MSDSKQQRSSSKPNQAEDLIRQSGMRITRQRVTILEILLESDDHPTAWCIYERARERTPEISLATVYNTLEHLSNAGVLNHLHFDNGPSRYCPNLIPHVHLVNDQTHEVLDVCLKEGLTPQDIFDLPDGICVTSMEACLHATNRASIAPENTES